MEAKEDNLVFHSGGHMFDRPHEVMLTNYKILC